MTARRLLLTVLTSAWTLLAGESGAQDDPLRALRRRYAPSDEYCDRAVAAEGPQRHCSFEWIEPGEGFARGGVYAELALRGDTLAGVAQRFRDVSHGQRGATIRADRTRCAEQRPPA